GQGVSLERICILARKNSTLKTIAGYLNDLGISTQVHAASGFFDRREVLDLLSFLKFLVNPHDNYNLIELLRTPWFRIPDQKLILSAAARTAEPEVGSFWNFILKTSSEE